MCRYGILIYQKTKPYLTYNARHKKIAYACLAVTSIVWGTTWVGSRYAAIHVPGLQVSYLRQCIAGTLVLLYFLLKGTKMPSWHQFKWLLIGGFFMFFLNNGMGTWSVHYISGGLGALITALNPICMVVFDFLIFKKRDGNLVTFFGLLTGIVGVVFVLYESAFGPHPPGYIFGMVICFIGVIGWSIGSLLIVRNKITLNPYYAMGWQMLLGSVMIYLLAILTGNNEPLSQIPMAVWEDIGFLSIIGSVLTFMAFIYTLKHLPPAVASVYAYINPIIAMLAGAELLHETLTINLLTGSLITIAGVYLVNYSLRKEQVD
jgi:drug/metabolite transporter (DMT)-like permease